MSLSLLIFRFSGHFKLKVEPTIRKYKGTHDTDVSIERTLNTVSYSAH